MLKSIKPRGRRLTMAGIKQKQKKDSGLWIERNTITNTLKYKKYKS